MNTSNTALIMENMQLHGAGKIPLSEDKFQGEEDFAQEASIALQHISDMFENTPLERYTSSILSDIINSFSRAKTRIEKDIDYLQQNIATVIREQDGSEIKSVELEDLTAKAETLDDHSDEFQDIIGAMATTYSNLTGRPWSISYGSIPRSSKAISAVIDAKDMIKAKRQKEQDKHIIDGNIVAFGGGQNYNDHEEIYRALTLIRNTVPKMILMHGGQSKGAELIASKWAKENNIDQIVYKPDFQKHNKAAPFRRNDAMIEAKPEHVVIFPGGGITKNLAQKAAKSKIKVTSFDKSA